MSWKKIGKIKEAHGLKGELFVIVFSKDVSWLTKLKAFALAKSENESEKSTFLVERVKGHREGLILKPKNCETRTQAEALAKQIFFIPEELLTSKRGERIYLSEILSFIVVTKEGEEIGPIMAFSSNGPQDLLVVQYNSRKVEIPLVDDFVDDIDFEEKKIVMKLPPGLLEIEDL